MLKTGITSVSELREKGFNSRWGRSKSVSISLYPEILNEPDADRLAERILLHFMDDRGAFKRTYTARFDDFDKTVCAFLKGNSPAQKSLIVQDVGVSDGRTACDFFEELDSSLSVISFFASDYNSCLDVIESSFTRLTLRASRLLEVVWGPFVFYLAGKGEHEFRKRYPLSVLIRWYALHFPAKRLLRDYHAGKIRSREILLFSPRALRLASKDKRFFLEEHNILEPLKRQSHVVRAMNLLNPSYFTREEFSQVLRNIHIALYEDGFLITGSNQDAGTSVQGGIYCKTSSGFKEIRRFGNGSSIAQIIENFKL
ncbi:MAG: hypothetical protein LBH38_02530 [Holosporales bacterium]|nr:hypothetical protein [Holosporales bacterium]